MKLLLHICCAPCGCYPYSQLKTKRINVKGFFYNPNIHPYLEYKKRLSAVKQWAQIEKLDIIYNDSYELDKYLQNVVYREAQRCRMCYYMRLESAAKMAKRGKFDAFTTTLLYSIYQKHELIVDIAGSLAKEYGIDFYYEDFRSGWREGILLSQKYNLYRQQYCGCIYSEYERFGG